MCRRPIVFILTGEIIYTVRLHEEKMQIGIDLGGTKIAGGLVHGGSILKEIRKPTEAAKGRSHVLRTIRGMIDELGSGVDVEGVGIGVPGVVSGTRIRYLTNIPSLNGIDLAKVLKVAVPVALENDARVFALAENRHGAGKGVRHMLAVTLGTGLGSAVIIDGSLHRGAHGYAGETGYTIFNAERLVFGSDRKSRNWEMYLGGQGIMQRHRARGGKEAHPTGIWESGSLSARKTLAETGSLLAIYLANVSLLIDPEIVVFGGSISHPALISAAQERLRAYLGAQGSVPELRISALGERSAILGAAAIAPGAHK